MSLPDPHVIDADFRIFLDNGQEITFAHGVRLQIEGLVKVMFGASGPPHPGLTHEAVENKGITGAWCLLMIMPTEVIGGTIDWQQVAIDNAD